MALAIFLVFLSLLALPLSSLTLTMIPLRYLILMLQKVLKVRL